MERAFLEESLGRGSPWALVALAGGALMVTAATSFGTVVNVLGIVLEALFIAYFVRHLAFAASALRALGSFTPAPPLDTGFRPQVTVLVACKNEKAVVEGLVESLLRLEYPPEQLQLLIVDDGSTDGTDQALRRLGALCPRVQCLYRTGGGGGKAGALNAGLEQATGEVIVVFDADHTPHPDVVCRLVRHFEDLSVGAVQGRCIIRNAGDSPVARLVALDYLAGYLVNEYGRQSIYQLPAYGGANCAVRASYLRAAGGWNSNSVTEDTDLTLRLILAGHRVRYDVTAVDEEEGVSTLGRYWRQRYRWARGHQKVWRDYRSAVWASRRLSLSEKVETTMFLLAFHVPVASAMGLAILALWVAGVVQPVQVFDASLLWTFLFLGPLLELGGALLLSRSSRREALGLIWFMPLFLVSITLCTKAWVDGLAGRPYSWVKTERSATTSAQVPIGSG